MVRFNTFSLHYDDLIVFSCILFARSGVASHIFLQSLMFCNIYALNAFISFTGKVEMITGVGRAMHPSLAQWDNPNRPIAASGIFGHYMVTPANEALFVVNGETRTVNCEIGGLVHPRSIVWVTMQLQ